MRTRNLITAVLLSAFMAACGGDGVTEPDTVAGTYILKTVDGKPMPAVLYEEPGYKFELISSNYVLTEAGTFTNNASWRETDNGSVNTGNESSSGTFTVNGSTLSFISPGGDAFQGTRVGNTLTLNFEGVVAVYVK